jgi:hypothetical protein
VPKHRSPVLGFNHNVRHKGWVFHVQTEDSGVTQPHIYTHLFREGIIIATRKIVYDAEADVEVVKGLMQAQHKAVLKELKGGLYDEKILKYLGTPPGEESGEIELIEGDAIPEQLGDKTEPVSAPPIPIDAGMEGDLAAAFAQLGGDLDAAQTTPLPGETEPAAPTRQTADLIPPRNPSAGVWVVSRPGQQERPFDRTGPVKAPPPPPPEPKEIPAPPGFGRRRVSAQIQTPTSQPFVLPQQPPQPPAPTPPKSAQRQTPPGGTPRPTPSSVPRQAPPSSSGPARPGTAPPARPSPPQRPQPQPGVVVARPAVVIGAPPQVIGAPQTPPTQPPGSRRPGTGVGRELVPTAQTNENIFGQDLISEKSLDEVIMAYLSEDSNEE